MKKKIPRSASLGRTTVTEPNWQKPHQYVSDFVSHTTDVPSVFSLCSTDSPSSPLCVISTSLRESPLRGSGLRNQCASRDGH